MHKSFAKLVAVALIAGFVGSTALTVCAQETKTNAAPTATTHAKVKHAPFHGTVASVDAAAKTVTLEGPKKQMLQITGETKITKDGKDATFSDIAPGVKIRGSKRQNPDGKWTATSLKIDETKK